MSEHLLENKIERMHNEIEFLIDEKCRLHAENKKLKEQLEKSEAQNYCKICGNTLDGYKPIEERKESKMD